MAKEKRDWREHFASAARVANISGGIPGSAVSVAPYSPNAHSGVLSPSQRSYVRGIPWREGGRPPRSGEHPQGIQRRDVKTGRIKGVTRTGTVASAKQNAASGATIRNQRYSHHKVTNAGMSRRASAKVVEAQRAAQAYADAVKASGQAVADTRAGNLAHRIFDAGGNATRAVARALNNPLVQDVAQVARGAGRVMGPIANGVVAANIAENGMKAMTDPWNAFAVAAGGFPAAGAAAAGYGAHLVKRGLSSEAMNTQDSPFSNNFNPDYGMTPEAWDRWYGSSVGNGKNPTVTDNYYDTQTGGWRINRPEPWKHAKVRDGKLYMPVGAPMTSPGDPSGRYIENQYNRKMPWKEVPENIWRKVKNKDWLPEELRGNMAPSSIDLPEVEIVAPRRQRAAPTPTPQPIQRDLQGIVAPPEFNMPVAGPRYSLPQPVQQSNNDYEPWIHNNLHSTNGTMRLDYENAASHVPPRPGMYDYEYEEPIEQHGYNKFFAYGYNPFRII